MIRPILYIRFYLIQTQAGVRETRVCSFPHVISRRRDDCFLDARNRIRSDVLSRYLSFKIILNTDFFNIRLLSQITVKNSDIRVNLDCIILTFTYAFSICYVSSIEFFMYFYILQTEIIWYLPKICYINEIYDKNRNKENIWKKVRLISLFFKLIPF